MNIPVFLQSMLIGFSIAAPVGPIGILCIRRTLLKGRWAGFATGLGAATADAFYGAIAAFGLTFLANFLINQSVWMRIGGGLFLIFLGIKFLGTKPSYERENYINSNSERRLFQDFLSTFLLTLSNPLTILSFSAIIAGFGSSVIESRNYFVSSMMILGIFLGSSLWWILLTYFSSLFRNHISSNTLVWINRIAGGIILLIGTGVLLSLYSGVRTFL
jgi:threonine/homoserine/homoserine lactone efflux protein